MSIRGRDRFGLFTRTLNDNNLVSEGIQSPETVLSERLTVEDYDAE